MFDFTTLVLKLGSLIALLGIVSQHSMYSLSITHTHTHTHTHYTTLHQAVVISDVIVLYVLKKRSFYKENKYQQVLDPEIDQHYEIINNPPGSERQPLPTTVSGTVYNIVCIISNGVLDTLCCIYLTGHLYYMLFYC